MPHLQEKPADDKSKHARSLSTSSEAPITEAKEGFLQATEGLLTIKGMTSAHQTASSFGPPRAVSEDASCTPRTSGAKQSVITPSPFGGHHNLHQYGPIVTIYGQKRLVPSPIRVRRRPSQAEVDCEDGAPEMQHPTNLRYADDYSTPTKEVGNGEAVTVHSEPLKKRLLGKLERHAESPHKKQRVQESGSEDEVSTLDQESKETSPSRKPVISPTNSEEGPPGVHRAGFFPPYAGFPPHAYPPHHHPTYHHYPPGPYPMYNGYPTPRPAHFVGRPGAPPMTQYPPYYHPAMMHSHPPPSPRGFTSPPRTMAGQAAPDMMRSSLPNDEINSVADWRRANVSAGQPPSANRCLPLKEPIPSKYWGNAEKTKDVPLPDFHRLVNFPDHLVKSRGSDTHQTPDGKKNCVMCGKLRLCSASSLAGRGRAKMSSPTPDDCSGHIIPRQNKGLCTACDVTVWVVTSDGIEIKWCKGCKNFRSWAAFGDKGSATKCGRCRDRQREKYAAQKDELKQHKPKQTKTEPQNESDPEEVAAFGLQTLINAATV